jgi:alpha-aminoadipate carrier protein LysW
MVSYPTKFWKRKSFKLIVLYAFKNHEKTLQVESQNRMKCRCSECDSEITIPKDAVEGEIVTCPDCGLEFELSFDKDGKCNLKIAEIVGEDWGE